MKKLLSITGLSIYYVGAVFIYAGWLFHVSRNASIFCYSKSYALFLLGASALLWFPALLAIVIRKIGVRGMAFTLIPLLLIAAAIYGFSAIRYYYTQRHLFDPFLQINPKLMTPEEMHPKKEAREFRVLCLGGSTTEAEELPAADRYPEILKTMLQSKYPDFKIKVFNAGRAWYTTKHCLINYVTYYADWKPDLVIVLHGINDLYRSFSPPVYAVGPYNELWSHFYGPAIYGANPPTFEGHLINEIRAKSLGGVTWDMLSRSWYSEFRFKEIDYSVSRYVSRREFGKNLRKIVLAAKGTQARVILVSQPFLYHPNMSTPEIDSLHFARQVCSTRRGFWGLEYPSVDSMARAMEAYNETTRGIAEQEGVAFADPAAVLDKGLNDFRDDVHYTALGSRKVAASIFKTIVTADLIKTNDT